jgi:hypothetical protein
VDNIHPNRILRALTSGTDITDGILDAEDEGSHESGAVKTAQRIETQIERLPQRLEEIMTAKLEDLGQRMASLRIPPLCSDPSCGTRRGGLV